MANFIHTLGSIIAFIFNKFFILLFAALILVGIPLAGAASFITNRESVKQVLVDGGVYSTVIDNALDIVAFPSEESDQMSPEEETDSQSIRSVLEQNGLIDPDGLEAVIQGQLSPDYIRGHAENFIDATYDYLDGSSPDFEVSFTVSDRAPQLAEDFSQFILGSLQEAPSCSPLRLIELERNLVREGDNPKEDSNFDLLDLDCIPPGSLLDQQINDFLDQLSSNSVFTETYDQDELGISNADLVSAKVAYGGLSQFSTIFWVAFVSLAAVIIMTGKTIYRGFKEVGVVAVVFGLFNLIIFAMVANADRIIQSIRDQQTSSDAAQIDAIFNIVGPLITNIVNMVGSQALVMSIVVIALGILSFIMGIFLKKHHVEHIHMIHPHHHQAIEPERIEPDRVRPAKVTKSEAASENPQIQKTPVSSNPAEKPKTKKITPEKPAPKKTTTKPTRSKSKLSVDKPSSKKK